MIRRLSLGAAPSLLLFLAMPLLVFPLAWVRTGMMDPAGDEMLGGFAYLYHSAQAFWRGEILWTPSVFLGLPLVQQPEFGTFYPPHLLLPLLPPLAAHAIYTLGHYVLAQVAAYIYLRGLGASRAAATLAGVAYGFCGFMMGHRGHLNFITAAAWSPIFLHYVHRSIRVGGRGAYLGAAIAFGFHGLTGAFQPFIYLATATVILYGVIAISERRWRPLLLALLAMAPGGMLAALQVLPSMELAAGLAMKARESYGLSIEDSWHPSLFPSLFLLRFPASSEQYSHAGAVVFAAAVTAAAAGWRRPMVRAWAVVALVAVPLMLGGHIPLLAEALHQLPVVHVFRIPSRHNFELGLALAVLAGLGLDLLLTHRALPPGGWKLWLVLLPALMVLLLLLARALAGIGSEDDVSFSEAVRAIPLTALAVPVGLALLWVAAAALPRGPRLRQAAAAALVLAAVYETVTTADNTVPGQWPDRHGELARADFRSKPGSFARVLSVTRARGFDSISGNTSMLFPGMQQILAYASTAPSEMVELFNTDMHGEPLGVDDLRWSRLPAIFSVTHIIMPRAMCGTFCLTFSEASEWAQACPARGPLPEVPVPATPEYGSVRLPFAPPRFFLNLDLRLLDGEGSVVARFKGRRLANDELALDIALDDIKAEPDFQTFRRPVKLTDVAPSGIFGIKGPNMDPMELNEMSLVMVNPGEEPQVSGALGRVLRDGPVAMGVVRQGGRFRFDVGESVLEVPYHLPRRPVTLEVQADAETRPDDLWLATGNTEDAWPVIDAIPASDFAAVRTRTWTFVVAPDAQAFQLGMGQLEHPRDNARVRVRLVDACGRRRYQPVRGLASGLWLYESREALPRVYAITRAHPAPRLSGVARLLRDARAFHPGRSALITGLPRARRFAPATILSARFGAQEVTVRVRAPAGDAFIVINDRFEDRWRAEVDGRPARIWRVNGVVRGIQVRQGEHVIRAWRATPSSLYAGGAAAVLGLLLAGIGIPHLRRRYRL